MRDLKPTGIPIEIEGTTRYLLFTLNVIDALQEHFDAGLDQIIENLADDMLANDTLRHMLRILLNDEAERKGGELKSYSEKEIGWVITLDNQTDIVIKVLKAYGISLPEAGEESPN